VRHTDLAPELYTALVENSPDCIKLISIEGRLLHMNLGGFCAMEVPEPALVLDQEWTSFWPTEMREVAGAAVAKAQAEGRARFQGPCPTFSGKLKWWDVTLTRLAAPDGAASGILCVSRDITELREALGAVRADEDRYRMIAENTSDIIVRADLLGVITYVSPACRALGYEPGELVGRSGAELVHPEDMHDFVANTRAIVMGSDAPRSDHTIRYRTKGGEWVWLQGNPRVVRNDAGAPVEILNVFRDVTEQKRLAVEGLRQAEFATMARELAGLAFWRLDVASKRISWSKELFEIYGLPSGREPSLEAAMSMTATEDQAIAGERLQRAIATGQGWRDALTRIQRPDGEIRYLEGKAVCEVDRTGRTVAVFGTILDVTDRHRSELALAASEDRLRKLVANAHQAIVSINEDGAVVGWNAQATATFGGSAEEALGSPLTGLIIPEASREAHAAGVHRLTSTGEATLFDQRIEVMAKRKTGEEFPIELALSAVRQGERWEITALMHDISERRAKTEVFENAFGHAAIGMALVDLEGGFLKVNPAFCHLVGYAEAEMLALDFQTITHPDDLESDLSQMHDLLAGRITSYRMDKRYIRADHSVVWVQLTASLVHEQDGRPKYFVAQVEDLTARRNAEARYRTLAENASDIVGLHDLDGTCRYMSPSSERLLGYTPDEMVGRPPTDFMPEEDHNTLLRAQAKLVASTFGEPIRHIMRMRQKNGALIWVEVVARLVEHDGRPMIVAATRDVNERVLAQLALEQQSRELDQARIQAEAAAAAKAEFLANMSHEIRTPLTAVIGFNRLLAERNDLSAPARTHVERVGVAGRALLSLVNDVLDYSKIEAGQFEIKPEPVLLEQQVLDALTLFQPQADEKGLTLSLEAPEPLPACVSVDPKTFRQILLNLIGNALKFTDEGGVRITVRHVDGMLACEVTDTGPGLSRDQQSKLFQRFSQVDGSSTRKHGGTGLGLAICKGLSEAMGGSIGVRSIKGEGATFFFSVAAPVVEAPADADDVTVDHVSLAGARILVVDDNPTNRELARAILDIGEADVTEASSGNDALELAAAAPFDLILLDLRMPGLDGTETCRLLRTTPGPNRDIPVLAFSADTDLTSIGGRGFNGFVRKPIEPLDLLCRASAAIHEPAAVEAQCA